jgi:hypothetical protein
MDLCRETSRILKTDAPRRAALVRKPLRRLWALKSATLRLGQVIARPHSIAILAGDDPEAVVLDFVQPERARWRPWGGCGKAGGNEAGRQRKPRTQQHGRTDRFFRAVRSMWRPQYATTLCAAIIDS